MSKAKEEVKTVEKPLVKAPRLGQTVYYHKLVQTGQGPKIKAFAAVVVARAPKESNFQPADCAVNLYVFTDGSGGTNEVKCGVMIASTPTSGRYTIDEV